MLVFPVVLIAGLFLVPFISNRGERAPSRRPMAVLLVIGIYTVLIVFTYEGATSPWSPVMDAWTKDPVPVDMVKNRTPLQLEGAALLQIQELPQLPCPGWSRRPSRPRPEQCRFASHARSADRPGEQRHPRRRQHARLRQASQPGGNDGAGRIPDQPAASRRRAGQGTRERLTPYPTRQRPVATDEKFGAELRHRQYRSVQVGKHAAAFPSGLVIRGLSFSLSFWAICRRRLQAGHGAGAGHGVD